MAQIATRGGGTPFETGFVTVAELLRRTDAPAAPTGPEPPTEAISVGSLLRREGRAPHSLDRPLLPRPGEIEEADDSRDTDVLGRTPAPRRGTVLRRGALVAGAVVAAGSVLGAAAVSETTARSAPLPTEEYPGQGALDAGAPAVPVTTLGTAAQSGTLDSGTPAPTSWMNVGFPSAVAGTGTPRPAAPVVRAAAPRTTTAAAPAAPTRTGGTTTSSPPSSSNRSEGVANTLGDAVGDVGKGTPIGGVTGQVGDTVSNLGGPTGSARSRSSDDGDDHEDANAGSDGSSSSGGGLVSTVTGVLGGLL